jgi:transposase-like protein
VLFVVADWTAETLLALITKHIWPGTTIYSDCWASYSTVQAEGYQHQTVNHSVEFMAEDGTCTNTIEGCWKHSKRLVSGGKKLHLASYLGKFCWRQGLHKKANDFLELLALVKEYCSGVPGDEELEIDYIGDMCVYTIHQRGHQVHWDEYTPVMAETLSAVEEERESEIEGEEEEEEEEDVEDHHDLDYVE